MSKQKAVSWMKSLCILFAIIGVIFIWMGFSKKNNYSNPDSDYSYEDEYINSYVGGDAYNYIINGTYFTAYAVIGTGALIISAIIGSTGIYLYFAGIEKENGVNITEER